MDSIFRYFASRFPGPESLGWAFADRIYKYCGSKKGRFQTIRLRHGVAMRFDMSCSQNRMMAYGVYERSLVKALSTELSEGNTFIDVGANIGYFSLLGAKLVGETGTVASFEPIGSVADRMRWNINLNEGSNRARIDLYESAVGASNLDLQLNVFGRATGITSRFVREDSETLGLSGAEVCPQVKLDDFFGGFEPSFIKIDCEGSEGFVIEGAERLISRYAPTIYFEYSVEWTKYGAQCLVKLCELLHSYSPSYDFFDLDCPGRRLTMDDIEVLSGRQLVNVLCKRC